MIKMVSLRTFLLRTTTGHMVQFQANVPRDVPEAVVQDAMAVGCVPVDSDDAPRIDNMARAKTSFQGDLRRSLIYLAMDVIARGNNSKDFDGGGKPKVSVLTERLGFDTTAAERTSIWQEYLSSKNQGADGYMLHPDSEMVMEIIGAEDAEELRQLAVQAGVDPKSFEGMPTRDVRKILLAKFSGVSAG